jgi:hypothetical protein
MLPFGIINEMMTFSLQKKKKVFSLSLFKTNKNKACLLS